MKLRRIGVFCGSSAGVRPDYARAAEGLGTLLALRGIALVYGGGKVGMMGCLARAALQHGGKVIGVIPQSLHDKNLALADSTELHVVGTMHDRKALISELSDGFMALPGGLGTLDEMFEALTWGQLGMHRKPCGLLDVAGFYAPLLEFLDHVTAQGFVDAAHRSMVLSAGTPEGLLELLESYEPVRADKVAWALGMAT